jgi:hypothetical protein
MVRCQVTATLFAVCLTPARLRKGAAGRDNAAATSFFKQGISAALSRPYMTTEKP